MRRETTRRIDIRIPAGTAEAMGSVIDALASLDFGGEWRLSSVEVRNTDETQEMVLFYMHRDFEAQMTALGEQMSARVNQAFGR